MKMTSLQLKKRNDAGKCDEAKDETTRSVAESDDDGIHPDAKEKDERHQECSGVLSNLGRNHSCLAVLGVTIGIVYFWLQIHLHGAPLGISGEAKTSSVVTIQTRFTPLDSKAFSSFIDSKESRASLHGVLRWKTASVSWTWIQRRHFASFLPLNGVDDAPGHVWRLLPDVNSLEIMSSSKYVAPPPSGPVEEILHDLLSLFHPQPFLYSRYGPRGAVAVIRAKSQDCLDVSFRLHAEYQLNTTPRRPLWFTPAAFIGRLIINTTDFTVKHFTLDVPKDKPLNVDLEWLTGPNEDKDMEVTITHIPEMSLGTEGTDADGMTWLDEITQYEALALVEKEMYRFKQVDYHNFTDVYLRASSEKKPVHTLVLWGVLEDQSC